MIFQGVDVSGSFDITGSFVTAKGAAFPTASSSVQGDMFFHTTNDTMYVFTTSGSWTPIGDITSSTPAPAGTNIEYLVAAGGGSGGGGAAGSGGAGGAGGYLSSSLSSVSSGSSFTITIGAGSATSALNSKGGAGSNSTIAGSTITTITAIGGGLGGYDSSNAAGDGGSGGGGSTNNGSFSTGGDGTVGQGNDGGDGASLSTLQWAAGGGGGAGSAGETAEGNNNAGEGGSGLTSKITGTGVERAGGGGGGAWNSSYHGTATGGGGNGGGGSGNAGTAGTANTGGGGGGGGQDGAGGTGGSGVVILAYPTGSITGRGGIVTTRSDGQFVHTFNESGTLTIGGTSFMTAAPTENFNTVLFTGNGASNRTVTVGFEPDLIWQKFRNISYSHQLMDSLRSNFTKLLQSDTNAAQNTNTSVITSTSNTGFTTGASGIVTSNGQPMVFWCFKAGGAGVSNSSGNITSTVSVNQAAGFSIVKWTTNGSASQTVGHGLSSTPELIIFKRLDSSQDWYVETNAIDGGYDYGNLNSSAAFQDGGAAWSTRATSTTITAFTSSNNFDYIAYCFHDVAGYQKIGGYSGDGSTSGNIIETGFKPAFLIIKGVSHGGSWAILDNKRSTTDPRDEVIYGDSSGAEGGDDTYVKVNFLSNGFEPKTADSGINMSGRTYIYLAISE